MKKYLCELIGTAVLVLFGCGTAVVSGGNLVATALAFGLTIIIMANAIGNISGCHINPAVSLAMFINKKMSAKEFGFYVLSQVIGAFVGAGILYFIMSSSDIYDIDKFGLGTNGFGESSAWQIGLFAAFIVEVVLTFIFVYTILDVTSDEKKAPHAGIYIGLALIFVHLLGINLTGTSVNPARSLAPAIIAGEEALEQVWLFIVAPFVGSALSALTFKFLKN
ncbi:MAG: aquaporin [Clostridia bacterium]|nr:aquaporin [Clostridia bacterium]